MHTENYESLVAQLPASPSQIKWIYKLLKPPVYQIYLGVNHIKIKAYYKDGTVQTHSTSADFSSPRMVMADFDNASEAMRTLLTQFPKHPWLISSHVWVIIVDKWEGGLTMIEKKAIPEMMRVASANTGRNLLSIDIIE